MTTAVDGVFHKEVATALQRQDEMGEFDGQQLRFIIPVRIGACPRLSSLARFHEIDLTAGGVGIDALVGTIREDWQKRATLKTRSKVVA